MSMRIRTDGEYAHRQDTIESAAERLDCNKTKAVLISCEAVGELLDGLESALEHEDLSQNLREDLAEEFSTRRLNVEVTDPECSVSWE